MSTMKRRSLSSGAFGSALLALALFASVAAAADDFKVTRGQLTFDAEGTEGGTFHSRKPHVPTESSGLTIGRGYDLKLRSADEVVRHMKQAGLTEEDAKRYAGGVGLSGQKARDYAREKRLPEITPAQQKRLFEISYHEAEADVRRICDKADVVAKYGRTDWGRLHAAIKDLLIDLRFRGDYTPKSRELLQKHVAGNDLKAFVAVIVERRNWSGVPDDRFRRRRDFATAAR
jgi:hypothetical protein